MMSEITDDYWESLEMVQKGVAQGAIHGIAQGIQHGIEQGIKLGKEEGRLEGRLEALRPVLVHIVETRFPEIAFIARQQAIRIKDPDVLKILVERVIVARTGGDVMRLFVAITHMIDRASSWTPV